MKSTLDIIKSYSNNVSTISNIEVNQDDDNIIVYNNVISDKVSLYIIREIIINSNIGMYSSLIRLIKPITHLN